MYGSSLSAISRSPLSSVSQVDLLQTLILLTFDVVMDGYEPYQFIRHYISRNLIFVTLYR